MSCSKAGGVTGVPTRMGPVYHSGGPWASEGALRGWNGHFLKVSAARMALGNSDRRVPTKGIHSLDDLRVGINGLFE